jgi:hypothetical protein
MTIVCYPPSPAVGGTALVVYSGTPNVAVQWTLDGPGTITPNSSTTDSRGVAGAVFTPAAEGATTISVTYGA